MFSDQRGIKLKLNNRKIVGKSPKDLRIKHTY